MALLVRAVKKFTYCFYVKPSKKSKLQWQKYAISFGSSTKG